MKTWFALGERIGWPRAAVHGPGRSKATCDDRRCGNTAANRRLRLLQHDNQSTT